MSALLVRPEVFTDRIDSFGYEYLSFENRALKRGEEFRGQTAGRELAVVLLGGRCSVESPAGNWTNIGGRANVFAGRPFTLYLPIETSFRIVAESDCDLAFCYCRAEQRFPARLVTPEEVRVEIRGGGNATRQIHHMLTPEFPAQRLLVVEVYTPAGTGPAIRRINTTCTTRRRSGPGRNLLLPDRPPAEGLPCKVLLAGRRRRTSRCATGTGADPGGLPSGGGGPWLQRVLPECAGRLGAHDGGLRRSRLRVGARHLARAGSAAAVGEPSERIRACETRRESMATCRLTMAQALIGFLKNQFVERDGVESRFFAGCFGIFGHGNLAGRRPGPAGKPGLPLLPLPQRAGHGARRGGASPARRTGWRAFALHLLDRPRRHQHGHRRRPGDHQPHAGAAPARGHLRQQQRRAGAPAAGIRGTQDISVNDCFKPVSRYWDRINRPDQLICALPEAMRVLTSPAQTGAVTLALPQDVQTEAHDYPAGLFEKRVWHIPRPRADREALNAAAALIRQSRRPLIVAGGGVIYSEATEALAAFAARTGIPVGETQAGKGSLPFDHAAVPRRHRRRPARRAANLIAREADLVIGIGTRYSDFTTASKTAFQNPECDSSTSTWPSSMLKHDALPADGRCAHHAGRAARRPGGLPRGRRLCPPHRQAAGSEWDAEVERLYASRQGTASQPGRGHRRAEPRSWPRPTWWSTPPAAAPGDLHKLWRTSATRRATTSSTATPAWATRSPAAWGSRWPPPAREVYVIVGDGSYLMMSPRS